MTSSSVPVILKSKKLSNFGNKLDSLDIRAGELLSLGSLPSHQTIYTY